MAGPNTIYIYLQRVSRFLNLRRVQAADTFMCLIMYIYLILAWYFIKVSSAKKWPTLWIPHLELSDTLSLTLDTLYMPCSLQISVHAMYTFFQWTRHVHCCLYVEYMKECANFSVLCTLLSLLSGCAWTFVLSQTPYWLSVRGIIWSIEPLVICAEIQRTLVLFVFIIYTRFYKPYWQFFS